MNLIFRILGALFVSGIGIVAGAVFVVVGLCSTPVLSTSHESDTFFIVCAIIGLGCALAGLYAGVWIVVAGSRRRGP